MSEQEGIAGSSFRMNVLASEILALEDFSIRQWGDVHLDLHNDYNCQSVNLEGEERVLALTLAAVEGGEKLSLRFTDVTLVGLSMNLAEAEDSRTIDQLYKAGLSDKSPFYTDSGDRGLFSLVFYNGSQVDFLASGFRMELL